MKINKDKIVVNMEDTIEIELENGTLNTDKLSEPKVEVTKVAENTSTINPIEFISKFLEQNGFGKGLVLEHIDYDSSINSDYDFQIIRSSNHDGTLLFTMMLLEDVVEPIIRKQSVHKDYVDTPLKDIKYTVGDIKLESVFKDYKQYETASLPVKCEYIYE